MTKRVELMAEGFEQTEKSLQTASEQLQEASKNADKNVYVELTWYNFIAVWLKQ